jgi:hypothetical protein
MKITFAGDISLFRIDTDAFCFNDICSQLFKSSDLVVGNLECPLTSSETKEDQAFNMSAPASSLALLKPFGVVSLANNHIRDYGTTGLRDTIDALNTQGIKYFGAGRTRGEALRPLRLELNGLKLAFIGATRFANATKDNGGGTACDCSKHIFQQIKDLKHEGFFVILYVHWGYEYVRIPSPRDRRLAHKFVDTGADLVIGSHPHIYQGIEDYKGKKIIYSLGNFIFHSSVFTALSPIPNDPRLQESFLFSIELNEDHTYTAIISGYHTDDNGVECYDATTNATFEEEVRSVSQILEKDYLSYLRKYYMQAYEISRQNDKIKKDFQHIDKLSFVEKVLLYKNANLQDVLNKAAGLAIGWSRKIRKVD